MTPPHKVICPSCGVALSTAGLPRGKKFRCPNCKHAITPASGAEEITQFLAPGTAAAPAPPVLPAPTAIQARPPSPAPAPSDAVRAGTPPVVRATATPAPAARPSPMAAGTRPKSRKPLIYCGVGALAVVVVGVVFLIRGWVGSSRPGPGPGPGPDDPKLQQVFIDPVTGRPDEAVVAWGPAQPLDYKKPIVLKGHRHGTGVVQLVYSPDGNKLASVSDQGEVILWNLATQQGRVVALMHRRDGSIVVRNGHCREGGHNIAFSADSKTLFAGSSYDTAAWDTETVWGIAMFGAHDGENSIIVSPSGKTLVTERPAADRGKGSGLTIWEVATQKALFDIPVDERDFHGVRHYCEYSPDGRFLAMIRVASDDALAKSAIRLFDLASNKELPSIGLPGIGGGELSKIKIDARFLSGNRLAVWEGGKATQCSVWNLGDGTTPARQEALQADVLGTLAKQGANYRFAPKLLSKDGKVMVYVTYTRTSPGAIQGMTVADPDITLHDAATLKTLASLPGEFRDFRSFAISADNKSILATVEAAKEEYDDYAWIQEYDAATGAKRGVLKVPMNRERTNPMKTGSNYQAVLAASPAQPTTVAVGLEDGNVVIAPLGGKAAPLPKGWKLTPQSPEVVRGDVQLITTAPHGLAPAAAKRRAEFPTEFRFQRGSHAEVTLALSHDASLLTASGPDGRLGSLHLWDLKTGKERWNSDDGPARVQFTPDNRFLVDDVAQVYNAASGEITKPPDELSTRCVAMTPDGRRLVVGESNAGGGGNPKILKVLSLPALALESSSLEAFESELIDLKYSADGSRLCAALGERNGSKLLMLDPQTGAVSATIGAKEEKFGHAHLALAPRGAALACVAESRGLELWDLASGKLRWSIPMNQHGIPTFLASGRLVASLVSETMVLDAATGCIRSIFEPFSEHEHKIMVQHICPARNLLAVGYEDGEVVVWDLARHGRVAKFKAHAAPIVGITVSADGRTLVTAGMESKVRVWTLER